MHTNSNKMSDEPELVNFWGKSSSKVWKYFGFEQNTNELGVKSVDKSKAVCRLCRKKFTYTRGTTNLNNHIRSQHSTEYASEHRDTKSSEPAIKQPKQSSIEESFGHKTPLSAAKKEEIDRAVENLIIKGLRPLSLVEDEGFIDLLKVCEPRYKPPSRATLVNRLKKRYEDMTCQLKQQL